MRRIELLGFLVKYFFRLIYIFFDVKIIFLIFCLLIFFVMIGLKLLDVNLLIGLVIVLFFKRFLGDMIINGFIFKVFKLVVCVCSKWK